MKVCIIGALPSSLINFRGPLIKSFINNGHDVIALAANATAAEINQIEKLGVKYIDYPVKRNQLSILADIKTLLSFKRIFNTERPDVILAYTIKPVIWGGIAAKFTPDAKFYGLITGLGFAFQSNTIKRYLLSTLVTFLYSFSLSKSSRVIFQNPDNLQVFIDKKIIKKNKAVRVNGSGVDLEYYKYSPPSSKEFTFLTIARLLGEKGLREYSAAASIIKQQYPNIIFKILGPVDPSPDGIPLNEVQQWHNANYIEYLGNTDDVRPYLKDCHIFVLASYHEGMPRTVLEAMATGRPILTTNVAGCKETVIEGENGFLVEKENIEQLGSKMLWFIENKEQWQKMADKSRMMAVDNFDVNKVNAQLLKIMQLNNITDDMNG
jgi:glycosyltransferase involved in cell wall biosynthesis